MDKVQVRYTPDEADLIAATLEGRTLDDAAAAEAAELREQAARLRLAAARARKRAATADPA